MSTARIAVVAALALTLLLGRRHLGLPRPRPARGAHAAGGGAERWL